MKDETSVERARRNAEAATTDVSRKVQGEVRKLEGQVKDTIREVEDVVDRISLSEPTPARSADEAKEQATALRGAISDDLDALQRKLPPGEELSARLRTIGGVVAGVAAGAAALAMVAKRRGETKRREAEAEAHAKAIARYLPEILGTSARQRDTDGGGGRKVLAGVLLVAGAAAAVIGLQQRGGREEPDIWGPPR